MRALVIVLILLVAGFLGLGFYQGWFAVSVDKDKMKADTDAAKDLFKGKSKEQAGTVKDVEPDENRFTLTTADDTEMVIAMTDASKVWRNKKAITLADLELGEEVTVKYREKDGKHQATSVTVAGK
jgi:hypothetical protein